VAETTVAHAPAGAVLAGAADGSPAYVNTVPSGAQPVVAGMEWDPRYDEEPDRCFAWTDRGRCKNGHKDDSLYCGIHKTAWEASDFLDRAAE
jgi:hypothetical protein